MSSLVKYEVQTEVASLSQWGPYRLLAPSEGTPEDIDWFTFGLQFPSAHIPGLIAHTPANHYTLPYKHTTHIHPAKSWFA